MTSRGRIVSLLTGLGLVAFYLVPAHVAAQANLNDLNARIITGYGGDLAAVAGRFISSIVLPLLGIAAFIFVLYGGFLYLTAGGDTARATQGQRSIVYAVIGIIIIFISYELIHFLVTRVDGLNRNPGNLGAANTAPQVLDRTAANTTTNQRTASNSGNTVNQTTGQTNSGTNNSTSSSSARNVTLNGKVGVSQSINLSQVIIQLYDSSGSVLSANVQPVSNILGTYSIKDIAPGPYRAEVNGPIIDANSRWCSAFAGTFNAFATYEKTSILTACNEGSSQIDAGASLVATNNTQSNTTSSTNTNKSSSSANTTLRNSVNQVAQDVKKRTSNILGGLVSNIWNKITGKKSPSSSSSNTNKASQNMSGSTTGDFCPVTPSSTTC